MPAGSSSTASREQPENAEKSRTITLSGSSMRSTAVPENASPPMVSRAHAGPKMTLSSAVQSEKAEAPRSTSCDPSICTLLSAVQAVNAP